MNNGQNNACRKVLKPLLHAVRKSLNLPYCYKKKKSLTIWVGCSMQYTNERLIPAVWNSWWMMPIVCPIFPDLMMESFTVHLCLLLRAPCTCILRIPHFRRINTILDLASLVLLDKLLRWHPTIRFLWNPVNSSPACHFFQKHCTWSLVLFLWGTSPFLSSSNDCPVIFLVDGVLSSYIQFYCLLFIW